MYTQVELISNENEATVFWLYSDVNDGLPKFKVGQGIKLALPESDSYLKISRIFTTMKSLSDLPLKSRIGTILEIN